MMLAGTVNTTTPKWNKTDKFDSTSHSPKHVRIYTENSETLERTLIYTQLPRARILRVAPAVQYYIDPDSGDIVLPGSDCGIEDETLCHVVKSITSSPDATEKPFLLVEEHPLAYIQTHVILVLLGLEKEARILQERFWLLFSKYELDCYMVSWIWETFGERIDLLRQQSLATVVPYIPPFSEFYVQVMAWQILNLGFEGNLNGTIHEYIWGDGFFSQPRLKDVIEARHKTYGLEKGSALLDDNVLVKLGKSTLLSVVRLFSLCSSANRVNLLTNIRA